MPTPPSPDDLVRMVLELFFGKASLVVFIFICVTFFLSWIGAARSTLSFGRLAGRLFDRTIDRYDNSSGKVRASIGVAIFWSLWYGVASFITQIWAGSSFSPGQGRGIAELLTWAALFGLTAVAGCLLLLPGDYEGVSVYGAITLGYLFGLFYAVVWFTSKGGPRPGDWYIAPAASCCLVLIMAASARLRAATRGESKSRG